MICKTCEPSAILGGLSSEKNDNTYGNDYQKNYNVKSNDSSIEGKNGSENFGMAVFKDDKLVGELNALETISYLNITNKIDRFLITVPDPLNDNKYLDIYLTPKNSTKVEVDTSSSSPYVKIKTQFTGRIYSMSNNSKYLESDVLSAVSESCNKYIESAFSDYLYKTSKDLKTDVSGLGKYALNNFFTTQEFETYDWLTNYQNAFFDVEADTSIKSGMLITET